MLSVPWYSRVKSAPSLDAKKHHQSQQWTTDWKVKSHLYFLDICKSVGAGGMDLRVLRELTDSTAKSLFHLWKVMEIRASPEWLEKHKYIPVTRRENLGNNRPVSLKSVPEHIMKRALMEAVAMITKDNKVIGKSQHGFTSGKSLTNWLPSVMKQLAQWVRAEQWLSSDFILATHLTQSPIIYLGNYSMKWILVHKDHIYQTRESGSNHLKKEDSKIHGFVSDMQSLRYYAYLNNFINFAKIFLFFLFLMKSCGFFMLFMNINTTEFNSQQKKVGGKRSRYF